MSIFQIEIVLPNLDSSVLSNYIINLGSLEKEKRTNKQLSREKLVKNDSLVKAVENDIKGNVVEKVAFRVSSMNGKLILQW